MVYFRQFSIRIPKTVLEKLMMRYNYFLIVFYKFCRLRVLRDRMKSMLLLSRFVVVDIGHVVVTVAVVVDDDVVLVVVHFVVVVVVSVVVVYVFFKNTFSVVDLEDLQQERKKL